VALAVLLGPLQRRLLRGVRAQRARYAARSREILENFGGGGSVAGTVFGFIFQLFAKAPSSPPSAAC
jgi:hypothetical protein